MPHVYMAWRHNLMRNQERRGDDAAAPEALASVFVDLGLGVLDAHAGFTALMNRVWPAWTPPALPRTLADALREIPDGSRTVFGELAFSLRPAGGLRLLSIWAVSALDGLTPRESQVAAAFASGQSYKEVARSLSISPATVRHYLREIYTKLELTDKVELANLINSSVGAGHPKT
jgi:DNA-binding CsgD family transcriptional regulator